jgi:hypothetical protein
MASFLATQRDLQCATVAWQAGSAVTLPTVGKEGFPCHSRGRVDVVRLSTLLTLDQRISDKSGATMRKFTDSDRLRLIEMHEHRAGVRGLGRDDLLAIGFALNRPPSDITSEILRLRQQRRLPFPPARQSAANKKASARPALRSEQVPQAQGTCSALGTYDGIAGPIDRAA